MTTEELTLRKGNSSLHNNKSGGQLSVWLCLCGGDILLRREGAENAFSLPVGEEPPLALHPWNVVTALSPLSLGRGAAGEAKVVRLHKPVVGIEGLEMMNLRAAFDVLSKEEYNLAGKAAELIYWDQNSKFCGCCGAPMKFETEISKRCTNCGKELWPQLATAVIVRVTRNNSEEVLLVHANNFRRPYYGLVAGFVETGEPLEEAVHREVREETGIEISDIRYFGSQPWPYPCGLMVGFTANYASGEIQLQRSELSKGGWFSRDQMPPIPGKASIARRLIDDWIEQD